MRLVLDERGLVLRDVDGRDQVLGRAGDVRRMVWLTPEQARDLLGTDNSYEGAIVVDGQRGPMTTLLVQDWAPPAPAEGRELLVRAGFVELSEALGVPLEPGQDLDHEAVRRSLTRPVAPLAWPGLHARWLTILAVALSVISWAMATKPLGTLLTAVALAANASVVLGIVRGRRQAVASAPLTAVPGAELVEAVPAAGKPQGLRGHALLVGAEDVVVRRLGSEVWLPGPAHGGVTAVVSEPSHVRLRGRDQDLAILQVPVWCSDEQSRSRLLKALGSVGVEVLESPVDTVVLRDKGDLIDGAAKPSRLRTQRESGDPTMSAPMLSGMAAWLSLVAALIAMAWNLVVGLVLTAAALALVIIATGEGYRRWRGDRRALRPVQ